MKNLLTIAAFVLIGFLPSKGQNHDVHVYMHNGDIHSFPYEKTDSITHTGNKNCIWTADSILIINISEIDSILLGSRQLPISFYEENFAGWADVLFCNNGLVVFHAGKTEKESEKTLIFLPDEKDGIIVSYTLYDDKSNPYLITFNDCVLYISYDDNNNPAFTVVEGDSLVYRVSNIINESYLNETRPLIKRAWADNNLPRNLIAIAKVITGGVQAVGGGVMVLGSLAGEAGSLGASTPISAVGLYLGGNAVLGGKDMINSGLSTLFVPAAESSKGLDAYSKEALVNTAYSKGIEKTLKSEKTQEFLKRSLPKESQRFLREAPKDKRWSSWTFWGGLSLEALDAFFGETITEADRVKAIYDQGEVVTGLVKDITAHSATVRGYVSPEITYGLNGKPVEVEYGIIVKGNGKNYAKKITDEHGGLIEFEVDHLCAAQEYTYITYILNRTDAILRFGEQKSFVTNANPPVITDFEQLSSEYMPNAFTNNGKSYSYKFHCATTVEIDDLENVEDWGYVYVDKELGEKELSLMEYGNFYKDTRYAYYRNSSKDTVTFYTYVKYKKKGNGAKRSASISNVDSYYYGEPMTFNLIYDKKPEATTLEPTFVDTQTAKIKCGYKEVAPWKGKCGVEYWYGSTDRNGIKTYFETADDEVEIPLNNLLPNTTYYYQAFIKVGEEYTEDFDGEYVWAVDDEGIKSFTTLPVVSFQTGEAKDIKETSALLTGTATGFDWTDERVKLAFYYSTEPDVINSTSGKSVTASYDENNGLSASLSGLCDYTTYYYTLGVKCGDHDVVYGEVCHFQTNPKVTTIENPTATNNSVTLQGTCSKGITIAGFSIMKDSDTEFTQYNVVPDEDGHFSVTIDNLDIETLYVYYAFVKANNQTITGNVYSFITRSILTICPDDHHPHMIDLGLPSGTKWACCNVGSSCPEEVGGYYAWGEVSEKSVYSPESQSLLDYFVDRGGGREPIFKNVGNITATQYDAAYVNWGSRWQTPTVAQFQELINNCTSEMFKFVYNGKRGVIFTGPNGSKIFLRAGRCKYIQGGNASEYSNFCMYWTSTFLPAQTYSDEYYFYDAFSFFWYTLDNEARTLHHSIPIGLNIRPVAR